MANIQDTKLIISGDSSGAVTAVNKVSASTKEMESTVGGTFKKLKSHWLAFSAAATGAILALDKAWELAEEAADYQERINSLTALGQAYGLTGQQIVATTKEAARGLVSMSEAADMSAKALQLGLSPEQVIEFTKVIETLTDVVGGEIPPAFNKMVAAAATGRMMSIQQMGIIVDLNSAYEQAAKSINKKVQELTELEKQQIRVNAILTEAQKKTAIYGESIDTTADKMLRLRKTIEDIKLFMGTVLLRLGLLAVGLGQSLATVFLRLGALIIAPLAALEELETVLAKIAGLDLKFSHFSDTLGVQMRLIKKYSKESLANIQAAFAPSAEIVKAMSSSTKGLGNTVKGLGNKANKTSNDIVRLNRQIQNMTDKATLAPVELIKKQADEWRKMGADRLLIAKWVAVESRKIQEKETEIELRKQEKRKNAYMELEESLTLVHMTEEEKKYYEVEKWVKKQMELNSQAAAAYQGYKDREIEILEAAEMMKAEIRIEENKRAAQEHLAIQQQAAEAEMDIRQTVYNKAVALLMMLGTKHKIFAAIGIAITTAMEMVRAWQTTITASMLAFSSQLIPGDPTSLARAAAAAAAVKAWGMANVALIGAMGAMRIAGLYAADSPKGEGGYTPSASTEKIKEREEERRAEKTIVVNVHIYGNVVDNDAYARELVIATRKAMRDNAH